ncbi:MAG: citrate/2-methylcitrate synthase [Treponema sp.]|nr:citrate/2-methylcitrate synthase [Treponema sp.]MBR0154567.1 citrate/2-methylcitrate synthase [Treponema sp.]
MQNEDKVLKKNPESAFLKHLAVVAQKNDAINPELYEKYDVKRGLRYSNGTGVLVGLTKIGDVVGYELKDGKKVPIPGKLLYRGYDIAELVHDSEKHNDFGYEQSVYLLMFGKLPTKKQLADFKKYLGSLRVLPPNFTEDMIMKAPSNDIMNKIARGVLASYSYDPDPENRSVDNIMRQCLELIARFSTLAAYAYQAKRRYYDGQSMYIHNPNTELSTAENFLHLIRFDGKYTKLEAQILDLALILHAEHGGGNNSSLTVHVVSSADTDTYSSIAAAVGSLKGRRHGGANIRVMEMMDDLKAHVKDWTSDKQIRDYLTLVATRKAFDKTGLIYGMGHAIYTVSDPRAVLLNELAEKLAKQKGCLDEFNLYKRIEKIAPEVIYSIHGTGKRICANVDFFSGFVYTMLGIPRELFTPLFAISRIAGWSAHRIEEVSAGGRIYRPAYKNICPVHKYVKIDDR